MRAPFVFNILAQSLLITVEKWMARQKTPQLNWLKLAIFCEVGDKMIQQAIDAKIGTFPLENRASAVFPLYVGEDSKSKILFLGYWGIKNDMALVDCSCTLRDRSGDVLARKRFMIADPHSYELVPVDWLSADELEGLSGFELSLEVEFFFEQTPRFTYPALALVIEGKGGSSAVHSCIRTYNKGESAQSETTARPQIGWDIYADDGNTRIENFVTFTGGERQKTYHLDLMLEDCDGIVAEKQIELKNNKPHQLHELKLSEIFAEHMRKDGLCRVALSHDIADVFPRFYCGNYSNVQVPTLTHSFFDMSEEYGVKSSLIEEGEAGQNSLRSVFQMPIYPAEGFETKLSVFHSNESFGGTLVLDFYDLVGNGVGQLSFQGDELQLFQTLEHIDMTGFAAKAIDNYSADNFYTVKLSFWSDRGVFPARLKFGYNLSRRDQTSAGSNVCFSSKYVSGHIHSKPNSVSWAPVGGPDNFVMFVHDCSIDGEAATGSSVRVRIYCSDKEPLDRECKLGVNATLMIDSQKDPELREYLSDGYGWAFVEAKTNILYSWYLAAGEKVVGGDHAF